MDMYEILITVLCVVILLLDVCFTVYVAIKSHGSLFKIGGVMVLLLFIVSVVNCKVMYVDTEEIESDIRNVTRISYIKRADIRRINLQDRLHVNNVSIKSVEAHDLYGQNPSISVSYELEGSMPYANIITLNKNELADA